MGSRPMAWHDSTSLSLMARLAFETSVSPATQNRSNPAPLPMLSMVTLPANPSSWNRSAIRSARGKTVELPADTTSPETLSGSTIGRANTSTCSVTVSATVSVTVSTTVSVSVTTRVTSTSTVSVTTCGSAVPPQAAINRVIATKRAKIFNRIVFFSRILNFLQASNQYAYLQYGECIVRFLTNGEVSVNGLLWFCKHLVINGREKWQKIKVLQYLIGQILVHRARI